MRQAQIIAIPAALLIAISASALSGCGGGGGGGGGGTGPAALSITGHTPASGASNVPATSAVSATFSKRIKSHASNSILVSPTAGGPYVSGTITLSPDRYTLSFASNNPLANSTTYTALAGTQVVADDDSTMAQPISWTFTTIQNAHGSLDSGFSNDGIVTETMEEIHAIATQPDGAILVAGSIRIGTPRALALARFGTDGVLDPAFGGGDGLVASSVMSDATGYSIAIQPDGKILVAGRGISTDGQYGFLVARFTSDGSVDSSFGTNGVATADVPNASGGAAPEEARGVLVQGDGKIVVAGTSINGATFFRLNSNGVLDGTFGTNGLSFGNEPNLDGSKYTWAGLLQADQKAIAVGQSNDSLVVRRVDTAGAADATFGNSGFVNGPLRAGFAAALQSDGKILVGCNASQIGRFDTTGTLDSSFNNVGYTNDLKPNGPALFPVIVRALAVQADGHVLVGGELPRANNSGIRDFSLTRLTPSGALDNSFGTTNATTNFGIGTNQLYARAIAVQGDGRILLGGYSQGSGVVYSVLLRFLP